MVHQQASTSRTAGRPALPSSRPLSLAFRAICARADAEAETQKRDGTLPAAQKMLDMVRGHMEDMRHVHSALMDGLVSLRRDLGVIKTKPDPVSAEEIEVTTPLQAHLKKVDHAVNQGLKRVDQAVEHRLQQVQADKAEREGELASISARLDQVIEIIMPLATIATEAAAVSKAATKATNAIREQQRNLANEIKTSSSLLVDMSEQLKQMEGDIKPLVEVIQRTDRGDGSAAPSYSLRRNPAPKKHFDDPTPIPANKKKKPSPAPLRVASVPAQGLELVLTPRDSDIDLPSQRRYALRGGKGRTSERAERAELGNQRRKDRDRDGSVQPASQRRRNLSVSSGEDAE